MLIMLYVYGINIYRQTQNEYMKTLILGLLGGITTYLVHGFFNDYLSYDKAAIPFWLTFGLVAAIGNIVARENPTNGSTIESR
jgi:hypothetical protein